MSSNPVSHTIAAWTSTAKAADLPPDARALVRRALLDTLAVTLLGSRLDGPRIVAGVEAARGGTPVASLAGMGRRADLMSAALVNGTSAHADLFDDNSAPMIAHPSAPLFSALLPLAEVRRRSGPDVMDAYVAGFETGVRLGRLLNPAHYEKGWHATRTLGILGCTVACCRLIGLDIERTAAAIGIAVSMASGVRQAFGTMTMGVHVGLTARDAIHCALLAEAGMQADAHAIEGKYGFVQLFAGTPLGDLSLGRPYELVQSGIIFKPYPSGAPTHAAIDAALALRSRLGRAPDANEVDRVECLVHPWNAMTLRTEEPRDMLQAKVNMRYCVAAALLHGEVGYRQFTQEALEQPALQALMAKVAISTAGDLPDNGEFPAEVRLLLRDAQPLSERREVPPGGSTRPLSSAEVERKFRSCAKVAVDDAEAERIVELVDRLDDLPDVGILCVALQGPSQGS